MEDVWKTYELYFWLYSSTDVQFELLNSSRKYKLENVLSIFQSEDISVLNLITDLPTGVELFEEPFCRWTKI